MRIKSLIKTLLKVAFAAALIGWMVYEGALDFASLRRIGTPGMIVFCAACVFVQIYINNYRWLRLMRGVGLESNIRETMPLSLIGMFFNFAMPGGVGGDVVKGYYLLQDHRDKKAAAVVSILMDRIMGFFVMVGTAFFALFLSWETVTRIPQLGSVAIGVSLLFLAFLLFFAISLSRRVGESSAMKFVFEKFPAGDKLRKLYESLHQFRHAKGALLWAVGLSVINQILLVAFVYVVAQAMDVNEIPVSMYFFLVPIGTVAQALPLSPAGIGVGQAAFYFLFNLYLGHESQLGPTSVTFLQLMNFCWGIVGAFFYLRRKKTDPVPATA